MSFRRAAFSSIAMPSGACGDKLTFLENGLEIGEIAPPRLATPRPRTGFAYFGQLNQFKGIKVLVEAMARVPAEIWGADRSSACSAAT